MRVSIERGFQPLVKQVMSQIQTDDPKLAINHIIGSWAAGQQGPGVSAAPPAAPPPPADEFAALADWS